MKHWDIEDISTRDLFEKTLKIAKVGIYELSVASNTIYWSGVTREITEVPSDFVPTLENIKYFFKEGNCREQAIQALHRAKEHGEPFDLDVEMITAKGNQRYVRNIGYPEFRNGNCVKIIGVLQDITERKRIKFDLTRKNQLLGFAEKMAHIGHWRIDPVSQKFTWSENMYRIADLKIGVPMTLEKYLKHIPGEDRKKILEHIDKCNETKIFEPFTHRIKHKDGSIHHFKVIGEIIVNEQGEIDQIIGTSQDITEFVHQKQELLEKNQQLNNAEKIAKIGHWRWCLDTDTAYWSDNLYEISGVDKSIKVDTEVFLNTIFHEDREAVKANMENAVATRNFEPIVYRIQLKDGTLKTINTVGQAITDSKGMVQEILGTCQDITEHTIKEQELIFKNQQLNLAEKMAKIGNWKWNALTNEVQWSDNLYDIYGHPKDADLSYEVFLNYVHEDDRPYVERKIGEASETGVYEDLNYRIRLQDGSVKTIKSTGIVNVAHGQTIEMLGTCQDITDQFNKAQEVIQKNQQLTFAEELAKIGYWEWDVVNDHLTWSDNMYRIFDMEVGTPLGFENVVEAIHPGDRDMFRAHAEEFIAEKKFRKFMHRIVYDSGAVRTVELYGEVVTDRAGNVLKMVGITQDITEQRMSEIKFRGLLDSAPDTMIIVDTKGLIQLANKQAEKMFGYKATELVDQHVSMLVPNRLWDTMEYHANIFFKDPKHTGLPADLDFYVQNKAGFQIPVQVTLSPLVTSEGLLVSLAIRDITEQKQSAHRILETNKSLKESANKLKIQNKQLAEFNHITSHNLRSPVSNLSSLINIYKTEEDSDLREELIEKMESVTNHLTWTLDTLVESLVIKNKTNVALEETIFESILQKTKDMLAAQILKTEAIIEHDFSEVESAMYNKIYLESIFLNLISNSLKYRDENRKPKILVKSKIKNGRTQLEFRDNGLGIDLKKNGHKLFGFSKVFHRNKDAKGVGLFLTKAQIDAMGGKIWAESEPGIGTSFFVNLNH